MAFTEILGYSAGALTAFSFLPQIIKTIKDKAAKNVSLLTFIIATINQAMWIGYGSLKNDWAIILTNTIVLVMSIVMIFLKLKYKKRGN
jgi:MtN3 and saliva related transmembrane protein